MEYEIEDIKFLYDIEEPNRLLKFQIKRPRVVKLYIMKHMITWNFQTKYAF